MALAKTLVMDKIEILEDGVIQARVATRVFDDGVQIGERFHRSTYPPTTALTDVPTARLRAHANLEWTAEVIAAYRAKMAVPVVP